MQKPIKTLLSIAISGILFNQSANAGAFSLYTEGSAAEVGNFAAGAAAEGADASIGFYNPAGLVLIHNKEAVLSGVGVLPSSKLTGNSTFETEGFDPYVQYFSGIQGGKDAVVPAVHYAQPLGPRSTFGLSILAPFGLSTDWGISSPVRYQATFTELKTINVSPELGAMITDHFSVGLGLDLQWAQVKFNRILGSPAALQFLESLGSPVTPTFFDSESYNKGHSFGLGAHGGVLGMFNDNHTRLGINYQSQVKHQFHGYSILRGRLADEALLNPNAEFRNDSLSSNAIALPSMTTFSIYQDVNDKLALLGSVIYAGWDSFKVIQLNGVAAYSLEVSDQVLANAKAYENYRNAWRFAVGANYRFTDQWMLRLGTGYDETPTNNTDRDIRLPDANRWALSIGGHYQMRPALGFDLGYTYLFAGHGSTVNKTDALGTTSSYNVHANADVHAQLVGLQAVWKIDGDTTPGYK